MTDDRGKFTSVQDVTGRFEGNFPSDRLPWVLLRIGDAESELMYQVPSLRKPIEQIAAESDAAGDEDRLNRVKGVVANKVLDLYRNPDGASQRSTTTPDITTSRGWYGSDATRGKVEFTNSELASCRLIKPRRRFGSIMVAPGHITR